MLDKNNEVFFEEYCKTCKYKNYSETDSPCAECIAEPVNLYSHKPVKWDGVDTLFNKPPQKKDHEVERAVREAVYLKASDTAKAIDRQSNLESRVHMRDLISCAINCICDTCEGVTYTYGQMEDILHSIITGEFHSDEKVITKDLTLGYKRWTSADLPNATEIGMGAFNGNKLLLRINCPNVTKIGYSALADTDTLLCSTTDFQNVESIDFGGFMYSNIYSTDKWYSYIRPLLFSKLTEMDISAFFGCPRLNHVQFDIITYIGDNAFYDCKSLTTVTAPNATEIRSSAFTNCDSLNFEFNSDPMPNVTKIEYGAFMNCRALKTIPFKKVTEIKSNAFNSCYNLEGVDLLNLVTLGDHAFRNCYSLQSVNLPNLVTVSDYAFSDCVSLSSANLPNVKTIKEYAFKNCSSLEEVHLESVTSIKKYAFDGCYNLHIIYLNNVESVPELVSTEGMPGYNNLTIVVPLALYEQFITHPVWREYDPSITPRIEDISNVRFIYIKAFGPSRIYDSYEREPDNGDDETGGLVFWFDPSSFQDKPSSQYYYMIEPFDGYDVLSLTDNDVDCTDSLETIYTDIPMFKIEDVDNASYGFVEDSSGWYISQNKGVKSSAALCKVVFNTTEATTIKFKAINYAETNYDYGIFGAIDATLSASSAADASNKIFWNGKSQHSASEIEITYQVPAGQHFIYIKYLKDGSTDKNNDCLKFKITTENSVRRTKKYKYTIDLSADAISHDVCVVFAEKKAEETPTETTN